MELSTVIDKPVELDEGWPVLEEEPPPPVSHLFPSKFRDMLRWVTGKPPLVRDGEVALCGYVYRQGTAEGFWKRKPPAQKIRRCQLCVERSRGWRFW